MKNIFTRPYSIVILALLCTLLWGVAYPMIKLGYQYLAIDGSDNAAKVLFAGIRFTISGAILLGVCRSSGRSLKVPDRNCLKYLLLIVLFETVIQFSLNYIGLSNTSAAKGAILNRIGTFLLVLCSGLFFRDERLTPAKVIGSLLGFAGIICVNFEHNLDLSFTWTGEGFVILASLSSAAASLFSKRALQQIDAGLMSGWQQLIGGSVLVLIGSLSGGRISHWSWSGILVLLYLVLVSSVAYTIWFTLIKYHGVARVTIWLFTTSLFGTIASALILGEKILEIRYLLALALLSAGILIVSGVRSPAPAACAGEIEPNGEPN